MAKSMLHAVVGMLVAEGRLVLDGPAPVAEWRAPADPGGAITLQHLLEMRDGLDFVEEYEDQDGADIRRAADAVRPGPVRHGRLRGRPTAGGAARVPGSTTRAAPATSSRASWPGSWGRASPTGRFLAGRLFGPLGMTSATATFDEAGTWVAASYVYATARDFARFGLLYLRDGMWDGRRLLPEGWVDHGRRPRSVDPDGGDLYGVALVDPGGPAGTFWASGHEGQFIDVCPVPRPGAWCAWVEPASDASEDVKAWRAEVIEAFGSR